MQGVDADHAVTTVLGALASAVLDLDHSISAGQLKADDPPEVLTGQLFRLAYNRWQNEQRREARMLQDIQRNAPPSDHGQGLRRDSPAESAPKKSNSPVFDAQIRELHDYMVETLDPRDMTIWIMYSEGFSEAEIAEKIQRHRTSVNRKIRRFGEIVERFLNAPSDRQD
jgi:DNA-directed RNA polymerase specialized sigma24 family protein